MFCVHIERLYRNCLKTVSYHREQRNNDKVKKTISKMVEPPKNRVQQVDFLTDVDFSKRQKMASEAER